MAAKITPPKYSKSKGYERYKQELLAWIEVTDFAKGKQGIVVALSLPEEDETGIRERVFDEMKLADLKKDDGLQKLIAYMDKQLGKDDLADCLEKFEDFEDYKREQAQTMMDYISKFDHKYNKIMKLNMKLPSAVLAFMLLKKADITTTEKMLVLTGMDYSQKDELYDQAKKSLLKFKGAQGGGSDNYADDPAIKLEPAFLAEHEEALWNAGYMRRRHDGCDDGRFTATVKNINPIGPDGRSLLCKSCGSFRHLLARCPDSWENMANTNKEDTESKGEEFLFTMVQNATEPDVENRFLKTDFNQDQLECIGKEARKCAVLDSACSSTVCGTDWMQDYLASLGPEDRDKVVREEGTRTFSLGGEVRLKSKSTFKIPAMIVGREVLIKTDVVNSKIPLLLSKSSMKKAGVKLDLKNDTAEIFGVNVALNETSSGHYYIPIHKVIKAKKKGLSIVGHNQQVKDYEVSERVSWNKGSKVRTRFVPRGHEVKQAYPKDLPTTGRRAMHFCYDNPWPGRYIVSKV